jgi:benzoate transport
MSYVAESPSAQGTRPVKWMALQVAVVILCTVMNGLDGMDLLIVSYIAPAMAADWHISLAQLGVVFSAGMTGMVLGCIVVAPFADSWGRRPIILLALVLMTLGSLGSGLTHDLHIFSAMRVLTGLGLGTLLASVGALVAEYAPPGRRSLAVGIFQAGYPVGAVLTGVAAIFAIPAFGWQATMLGAAVITFVLLPVVWIALPESVAFLESRQPKNALKRSNALRARLGMEQISALPERGQKGNLPKPRDLFSAELYKGTIALWMATFLSYGVLYFLMSWVPKISVMAGLSQSDAIWAGSLTNLGGVFGDVIIGYLAIRRDIGKLIALFFFVCSGMMMLFVQHLPLAATLLTAFGMGFTLMGGFSGFYSLAALIYPARLRSSGIGWAGGFGRFGAIIGPMVGGALLSANTPLSTTFGYFAVPLVISGGFAMLATFYGPKAAD